MANPLPLPLSGGRPANIAGAVPPHTFFIVSAVFHYLGPAFAVLLFAELHPLGVAWLRIASAAAVLVLWRRSWPLLWSVPGSGRYALVALGVVLGAMNACFYLALDRLPLGTVAGIEFLGPVALAALGVRTWRNAVALCLAVIGVAMLVDIQVRGEPIGIALACANCLLFALYIVLGHRLGAAPGERIDRLGAAMLVALVVITPVGLVAATPAFMEPQLLLAGIGVGICSSVIPYVCDQLAMARLPRATFALLLALLPACAVVIGVVVLRQWPRPREVVAILLIAAAVAVHRERDMVDR